MVLIWVDIHVTITYEAYLPTYQVPYLIRRYFTNYTIKLGVSCVCLTGSGFG